MSYSDYISSFLSFISEAKKEYSRAEENMREEEKLTQDLLHSLELDGLKCRERSKVATKLSVCRKNRRYYKDIIEELEPLMKWLDDPTSTKAINLLTSQALGSVRAAERYHQNREYKPKANRENKTS